MSRICWSAPCVTTWIIARARSADVMSERGSSRCSRGRERREEPLLEPCVRARLGRLDIAGPEVIETGQAKCAEPILGLSLHPSEEQQRPLGRFRAAAAEEPERQPGIHLQHRCGACQRVVARDADVLRFVHVALRDAETPQAGVVVGQLRQRGVVVQEIAVHDRRQLRVRQGQRPADQCRDFLDLRHLRGSAERPPRQPVPWRR